ncbi:MAG: hypothetical protein HY904_23205 [Deltaproteobacteria bacterium]|nr:hypothetical protein [Deltaproteobacteria bacterium]
MIVQCPLCKSLFDLRTFRAEDGVLSFTCAACGATAALRPDGVAVSDPPAADPLPTPPLVPAPSEGAPPPADAVPTPGPGLADAMALPVAVPATALTLKPRPVEPSLPVPLTEGMVAPAAMPEAGLEGHLNAAWNRAARDWGNPRAHEVFVAYCASVQALPFAGMRYRDHLKAYPRDKAAQKGRDRVLAQAVAMAANTRDTESVYRSEARTQLLRAAAFVGSAAAMGLVVWQLVRMTTMMAGNGE